jgi:hypothetical protein
MISSLGEEHGPGGGGALYLPGPHAAAERVRWGSETGAADARKMLAVGESPVPQDIPAPELASWTMLCNALMSSDRVIVKD